MRRDIIIDTDPGQDDAVAILLALASPGAQRSGTDLRCGQCPFRAHKLQCAAGVRIGGRSRSAGVCRM